MVSESQLRKIIDLTIEELGENATKENIQAVVASVLEAYEQPDAERLSGTPLLPQKALITVLGPKKPNALTALTPVFSKHNCDIIDISQKTLQAHFSLVFIVDISKLNTPFSVLQHELQKEVQALGLQLLAAQE
ncbi:ACT domain-containing protein-like protein [Chloroherpeton thalassium ATCC 35110]|uniref:ACT domain-containing protein-like protein n=1 Tax=Chloroherpeton thalassium (strain ATCC 35110 / GB-78) TaxID=517418 RepID=B3QT12_CHLT3|nr:ACT domain-containing protein [Chloroherpeton thalassium]ACF12655.1 ACT domain-containing protein-like protein [Chloroherpeton thalassium ATCC 35110]